MWRPEAAAAHWTCVLDNCQRLYPGQGLLFVSYKGMYFYFLSAGITGLHCYAWWSDLYPVTVVTGNTPV